MDRLPILYQLILADFLERTRRYSYFMTLMGALFLGYLVITDKYTIQFNDFKPIYNADWVGSLMAVTCSVMFTLVGFYLVKNSISRDRQTRVGQIIASTQLGKTEYLVAKFISNVVVLWSLVAVLGLVALVMLIFRGPPGSFYLVALVTPFVLIPLPTMTLVAAVAVLFESVRSLRGSLGNVLYLFVAEAIIVSSIVGIGALDLTGAGAFMESVRSTIEQAYPGVKIGMAMGFVGVVENIDVVGNKLFLWEGIDWSGTAILFRLGVIAVACCVLGAAVPFFNRFDPSRDGNDRKRRMKTRKVPAEKLNQQQSDRPVLSYPEIKAIRPVFRLGSMLFAELRLLLSGRHWSWYLSGAGLVVSQLVVPFEIVRLWLVPVAMIWPLVIWSGMGTRESRFNTGPLLFSSAGPLTRQFRATWLAGLAVSLMAVGLMAIRAIVVGEWVYAVALVIGALLVPSLALAMGTLTGSKKMFEVVYLIVWYVGSLDHVPPVDILGTTDTALLPARLSILLLLTPALLIVSGLARRRQVVGVD